MADRIFDEIWGHSRGRKPRPGFESIARWIRETPKKELQRRQDSAEAAFRQLGITFNVYGDEEEAERIIPFDIVPRVFTANEWETLSEGLAQRVTALNMFLEDVYGDRKILADGIVPSDLVLGNPGFTPVVNGHRPPHGVYAHICGIDMVRTGPDEFLVLEDNARTPSGVSYMLENREAMLRLCPELFEIFEVEPVDRYPDALREMMQSVAPEGASSEPCCVLLTPGHFNSAFYEHSFLADNVGIELVEAADLVVDDDIVWMRTIEGRKRVDVIYRRIDDDFLDPLIFRPDSMLGVPGLMAAYFAGNVTLINAPGGGISDDKAIYSYMPEIVKYYSGEDAKLPNVETWRCREADALQYTLDNLADLVVKKVDGSGGYGMLVGPTSTSEEIEEFRAALKDNPDGYIAQPTLALSTVPTLTDKGTRGRHVDFRPFCLSDGDKVTTVPGGLTRVALREGSLVVNSSQGGGTKDSLVLRPDSEQPEQPGLMLARTASYLYWIGRYMERAEFTARLIEATVRLDALSARPAGEGAWASALSVAAASHDFERTGETITPSNVANFLTFSKDNPNSIHNCLYTARMNARAVRTALTREGWEAINRAWLGIEGRSAVGSAQATINLLEALIAENRGFEGALHRMLRQESFYFLMLGENVERADNTARLIDVKYHIILPEGEEVGGLVDRDQWGTILQTVSANTAFRWLYRDGLSPRRVVEMLILRRELPRSIAATVEEVVELLTELGRLTGFQGEADRMARLRQRHIDATNIGEIIGDGLHEYLQAFIEENRLLSQAITKQFRFD